MKGSRVLVFCGVFVPAMAVVYCCSQAADRIYEVGLVGVWFGSGNLSNPKEYEVISGLDMVWTTNNERGGDWSGKWGGVLIAPATGDVTIHAETNKEAIVEMDGKQAVDLKGPQKRQSASISMVEGAEYPIEVTYFHRGGKEGYLKINWSWAGQKACPIGSQYLRHTTRQRKALEVEVPILAPKPGTVPALAAPAEHVIVYYEKGRVGAWPANSGVWSWGNEILVGFSRGYYKAKKHSHSVDRSKPDINVTARSLDGGRTWTVEDPENFAGDGAGPAPCPGDINFGHPDFAMRCNGHQFSVSYDRGKTWQGPYLFPDFGTERLTSRTDYIVNGPRDCLFFLSAKEQRVEAGLQDRAFCARTTDGGKNIKFIYWMTGEPIAVRSVMPDSVRISDNQLVSAMRRRHDLEVDGGAEVIRNWIDVYASDNNGESWGFLSKVADTDTGARNGNPPSMVRLKDGRLVVAYGYRATPYGIRAKISCDNGKTWSDEIGLRLDGRTWDLGYTRTVLRPDGKIVTIYYYTTQERPELHIAATIWDPDAVRARAD